MERDPMAATKASWKLFAWGVLIVVLCAAGFVTIVGSTGALRRWFGGATKPEITRPAPMSAAYVGAAACRECHQPQFDSWKGSHHEQAMQPAAAATVLGDFNNAAFDYAGTTSAFHKRDGKFMVRTDGPDGAPTEYEVAYTFGVWPLQQYLVAFPGGRYQALPVAWDARATADGGQRWFHLYPGQNVDFHDQLHWTGRYLNWNMMCADCHSTNLRKGYDASSNSYKTTFSEINVACEACHGPGSEHVRWARQSPYNAPGDRGLNVSLHSGWVSDWRFETPQARYPVRNTPPPPSVLNVCASCHSRRMRIAEGSPPDAPLQDAYQLSTLAPPLYFADGQQRDEVYEWGSFLQSRMYQRGVTCMDCHDPHTLKTRAEGNALCARCHNAAIFDTPAHHFHKEGSPGARCTSCHMPTRKYMVVHERLDHSIRVPRPDLSASTGSPDACTMCHADRKADWAAAAMDRWYPPSWRQRPQWGPTLAGGANQGAKGMPTLLALAQDPASPGLVRATAAQLAASYPSPEDLAEASKIVSDPDPSVRIAGLTLLEAFDARTRASAAGASLSDPIRAVRIAAARLLADVTPQMLAPDRARALELAMSECEASQRLNADWPAENVNAGNLALRRGKTDEALAAFRRAIDLDPRFVGAYVNLADLYRQLGRDPDAQRSLRDGLAISPQAADLHHALGLLLVRQGDKEIALKELATATSLAPDNARYAYVYAVGLHSSGDAGAAIDLLRKADAGHPFDPDILTALITFLRDRNGAGDRAEALAYARKLSEALPADPNVRQLVRDLGGP
jgi:predicted CXXCH cytochrome family protein